jgi:membrane peptidoglycan carboxypeptidase
MKVRILVPRRRRPKPNRRTTRRRTRHIARWMGALTLPVIAGAAIWEAQTSSLQSRYFSARAANVDFAVVEGPSPRIRFPATGPTDERLGYTALPTVIQALGGRGFQIQRQARISEAAATLVDRGVFSLYQEKRQGGLSIRDRNDTLFYSAPIPREVYETFDAIPEVVWRMLLYIEDRGLLSDRHPRRNPAVEWDRLARSTFELVLRSLGRERNVPGASTLATQLEKFRHSPEGRTDSLRQKLQQMESAALRAYLGGPETLDARKRIVRDYLNAVPLAAQRGHGEVVGTADGLLAWYGTSFEEANRLLTDLSPHAEEDGRRAEILRQVLSLLIAHRRPSFYLVQPQGRVELERLTTAYLHLLASAGVIPSRLADLARHAPVTILDHAPDRVPLSFIKQKAANQIRAHLLALLSVGRLYDLDRFDMNATATLDTRWQTAVSNLLEQVGAPKAAQALGLDADNLLRRGDPSKVIYSFTLMETTPVGNVVRVQTDTVDGPLDFVEASRVELGSTAKLRALVTYLEAIAEIHGRLARQFPSELRGLSIARQDALTRWVRDYVLAHPGVTLRALLDAAMERRYSASPAERFATGGGTQTFVNFDRRHDGAVVSVSEAFRESINLPMVRLMRDVVAYYMFRSPDGTARVLEDVTDPARQEYLARFADREGSTFVRQFFQKYRGLERTALLDRLTANRRLGPQRMAWALRATLPDVDADMFADLLVKRLADESLSRPAIEDLFRRSNPASYTLNDLAYLARIHPLELWVVRYLMDHPAAELSAVLEASRNVRQEVYQWLFRTSRRNAQDQRIRSVLEMEAFQGILQAWRNVGYPFDNIVPSFGTAIGSSGDRPLALAELVGIIQNDGVRYPVVRVEALRFAEDTPFETHMVKSATPPQRVLPAEVAAVARQALIDVVEHGTGRRARRALNDVGAAPLVIGGKTGTGDNRFRVFGPRGQVVASRAVNRTATFVFFAGDRYFGVVTAYVPGQDAEAYQFTSALPTELLSRIGRVLGPLASASEN